MTKKVLILEGDGEMLGFLVDMVKRILIDVEIMAFNSINGVYEAAMNSYIDLFLVNIILDRTLPGDVSGAVFIEKIRNVRKYEFTPVIFITSLQDPKFYALNQLHCYSFIEKPVNPDYVEETIRKALRFSDDIFHDPVLFFRKDGVLVTFKSSEISYIESICHKQHFYLTDGRIEVIPYKTCKQILKEIDTGDFLQCSRNTIINRRYVESIDIVNRYIKLKQVDNVIDIGGRYCEKIGRELLARVL